MTPPCLSALRIVVVPDLRAPAPDGIAIHEPALLLCAMGDIVFAGPLYLPGESVCLDCARHQVQTACQDVEPVPEPTQQAQEALAGIAAMIQDEVRCGNLPRHLLRAIRQLDTRTGKHRDHNLVPRADCPACGILRSEALPLTHHCSPLTGIVPELSVTGAPFAGIYSAGCRYMAPIDVHKNRAYHIAQSALGRGQTKKQAIESCIGEALERYSLIYTGREVLRRVRIGDPGVIDPRSILLVSERQYEEREAWNGSHDDRYWIPERPGEEQEIDVLPATDLQTGETLWAPAACCLMGYPFGPGEPEFAGADSIGCGAGRTFADAALSGICEWIERDAMAIWWYNRARCPAVRLDSFESPELLAISEALRRGGRELRLLDVSVEFGIPSYVAVAPDFEGNEPVIAAAASPSPRVAALKAASEASQLIFQAFYAGEIEREYHAWLKDTSLSTQTWLEPSGWVDAVEPAAWESSQDQLDFCVRRLADCGIRTFAVDQTSPDVLLRTVRMIAPGLRHIWARFAPGRLYGTPVQLGWRGEALAESDLNSILCMI